MPRNFPKERVDHAARRPQLQADLHALLKTQHPFGDHALVGWPAILGFLHDHLGLRRRNLRQLNRRIVGQWRRHHGFPLLRGNTAGRTSTPPLTTTYAATCWLLAQLDTQSAVFRVTQPSPPPSQSTLIHHAA